MAGKHETFVLFADLDLTGIVFLYSAYTYEEGVKVGKFKYSRLGNPNRDAFETAMAVCENAKCKFDFIYYS